MQRLKNYVNGQEMASQGTEILDIINPVNGETVAKAPITTAAEVDEAMQAAQKAFKSWKNTIPRERQRLLLKLADNIEENADLLIETQFRNTGQPRHTIRSDEVLAGADQIRFFAGAARILEGKGAAEYLEGLTSYIRREPIGVIAQVTPWNYPFAMAIWKIAPALAAGNTIVLKPSDTTPESTVLLAKLAGNIFPPGVFNVILGNGVTGSQMVEHPIPQLVAITGSVRAGMAVAKGASTSVKRVHLELGGKAPAVVFADADVDKAVDGIADFGLFNAGQDCTAVARVLVHESIHDQFVERLVRKFKTVVTGQEDDTQNYYGPLNNANHFMKVKAVLDTLPQHVTVAVGGKQVGDKDGFFLEPTILIGARQEDACVQEEIFGPVITVQKFVTEAEAVELANGVDYALASSVWTENHGTAMRMTAALDFGIVWVNTHMIFTVEMPHGGFKNSGYGKDLSYYGFEEYTRVKHVMHAITG